MAPLPGYPEHFPNLLEAGAMEAFGYKQLLFEPFVGGGLFTAASLPLIHQFGPVPVLIGVSLIMTGWLVLGICRFGPRRRKRV